MLKSGMHVPVPCVPVGEGIGSGGARAHVTRTGRTSWLQSLLHLHDSPTRTAAAFALGVFFGFSPFLGAQILLSCGLAFPLRLSRLAVFVGLNVNLPWIVAPWYAGTTLVAARLMGIGLPPDFRTQVDVVLSIGLLSSEFWARACALLLPWLLPFLVGPIFGAALVAILAYVIAAAVLRRRRSAVLHSDAASA